MSERQEFKLMTFIFLMMTLLQSSKDDKIGVFLLGIGLLCNAIAWAICVWEEKNKSMVRP